MRAKAGGMLWLWAYEAHAAAAREALVQSGLPAWRPIL